MESWLEINRSHLIHNYRVFSALMGGSVLAPVLKSNAYGHGLDTVYDCLSRLDPTMLAVNYVLEGHRLRQLGYQNRVIVVGPVNSTDLKEAKAHNLECFLAGPEALSAWLKLSQKPDVHVKFDTGMSRQGFPHLEAGKVLAGIDSFKSHVRGVCSHFSNVEDVMEQEFSLNQLRKFRSCVGEFQQLGFTGLRHMASSASVLLMPESRFDMGRVGISLYGLWPSQATKLSLARSAAVELKPVLSWRAPIAQIKTIPPGAYVSYGCSFKAMKTMRVGIIPVGYNEGYPRLAGEKGSYVLVSGRRAAVLGRVCMNMMIVDLTDVPGDMRTVTLIGQDGDERIRAEDIAEWSETIHYEVVTRIHPGIERRLVDVVPD